MPEKWVNGKFDSHIWIEMVVEFSNKSLYLFNSPSTYAKFTRMQTRWTILAGCAWIGYQAPFVVTSLIETIFIR